MARDETSVELIVLTVIAAAMAAFVVLDAGSPSGSARRSTRIVPEQRAAQLQSIELVRPGAPSTRLARGSSGGAFRLEAPTVAPLDDAAVDDFLGTLEVLAYRRAMSRSDAHEARLDEPRLRLRLRYAGGSELDKTVELIFGAVVKATDEVWIARSDRDRAYLIDGYAARSLDVSADDLRSRRVLRTRHRDVTGLEIQGQGAVSLILSGRPLMVHMADGPGVTRADPAHVAALLERIDDLRITRFLDSGPEPNAESVSIRVIGQDGTRELVSLGACPGFDDEVLVKAPIGYGCVRALDLVKIGLQSSVLDEFVDRHLIAVDAGQPTDIEISSAGSSLRLDAVGAGWKSTQLDEVDFRAVVEWARQLEKLTVDVVPERPASNAREVGRIRMGFARDRADVVRLIRVGRDLWVRRDGEAVAFPVAASAIELFSSAPERFRERTLWRLEPSALVRVTRSRSGRVDATLVRGQLLEDWTLHDARGESQVARGAVLGELQEFLARPRVTRFVTDTATRRRGLGRSKTLIVVEFDRRQGDDAEPSTAKHTLEIGPVNADGCIAREIGDTALFQLGSAACALLLNSWR